MTNTPNEPFKIKIIVDSSWADQPDRASSYGFNTYVDTGLIAFRCRKNPSIAGSAGEAEYCAYCQGSRECCFMHQLMTELGFKFDQVMLLGDSNNARSLATAWSVSQRTKHIDINLHQIRHNHLIRRLHGIGRIPTDENDADMHTKPLANVKFSKFRDATMRRCPQ